MPALALAVEQIDDLVGDPVADLVRVTFGNGLAGEEVILARHDRGILLR
jgi:hypothetical protein